MNSIVFLFNGRHLRAEQTPGELEMEDGDEVDAMLHQTEGVKFRGLPMSMPSESMRSSDVGSYMLRQEREETASLDWTTSSTTMIHR